MLTGLSALSMLAAFGFYLGWVWGAGAALASLVVAGTILVRAAIEILVTPDRVRVGRAVLETRYIAGCTALAADQSRQRSGPGADARAYLVLRPYLPTTVELRLDDPDDPVPYWLVSTRRAGQLAAAVTAAVQSAGHDPELRSPR